MFTEAKAAILDQQISCGAVMLTESSSGHTALCNGLSFQTKYPSGDFPAFQEYSLKTLLKAWCVYIQMVKCSQLGSRDVQAAHQFCKAEKVPLLESVNPKLGKA